MSMQAAVQTWTGWEEPKAAVAWKIEKQTGPAPNYVPFFPDQNGRVYEQLLHSLPVTMHCMDGMGRIMSANQQWLDAFGYARTEVEGKLFPDFLTPESRIHLIQTVYPRFFQTGECRGEEVTLFRKDGTLANLLLAINAYRGERGRIERSICILQDVTAKRIHEQASRKSELRLRAAFDQAAHGMAMIAATGKIAGANPAFKELLGRRGQDISALLFEDTLHADDRGHFLNGMKKLFAGEMPHLQQDLRFMTRQGGVAHGAASVSIIKDDNGDIDQLIVQIADITQRRQAQLTMQQAQKMEAIGQLTGGLAHDFNNLLTIIIGNLQLVDIALSKDEKAHKRAIEAIDAAQRGSELTKQLLAYSRRQALEPQTVQLNQLLELLAPLVARSIGEQVQLKIDLMPGDPKSTIDPSQLESAVMNLGINARDAMAEGGLLTLETQPAYLDEAYASKYPEVTPGHYVMVAVSDTGTGIPPELLEKVFQPFFTTKEPGKGSGLGLSMVYGFIKQSGGHIQVYSEPGHGTSIKMYLPRVFAEGEEKPPIAGLTPGFAPFSVPSATAFTVVAKNDEPEVEKPRQPKILVVEDQEAVREVACGFLADFGYDIIEAEDGFQALAKLQEHPDVDLMFTDVVMPGGMNGFDLAQAAYTIRPKLKVVHTSGYPKGAMVHQEEPRFREGFIIMKPYRREDLQRIIADALAKQD